MEAACGARLLVVAQMLAPKPCSEAPDAKFCQAYRAPDKIQVFTSPQYGAESMCTSILGSYPSCMSLPGLTALTQAVTWCLMILTQTTTSTSSSAVMLTWGPFH